MGRKDIFYAMCMGIVLTELFGPFMAAFITLMCYILF